MNRLLTKHGEDDLGKLITQCTRLARTACQGKADWDNEYVVPIASVFYEYCIEHEIEFPQDAVAVSLVACAKKAIVLTKQYCVLPGTASTIRLEGGESMVKALLKTMLKALNPSGSAE